MHSSDPKAVYIISVAARIVGMHANTLRKYERQGLIAPARTGGNVRLFSQADLMRLLQIKHLVEEHRVNLAGVEVALAVTDRIRVLRQGFGSDRTPSRDDVCRAIDDVLDMLSATPHPGAPADYPQEDADERRETHTRRREPVRNPARI